MPIFSCRTRGNADPTDKPRVYFTAHPDDLPLYLEKLCTDILAAHDCAIYYTEDMTEEFTEEEMKTDLGRMNLFAVPVTYRLLSEPCRAMRADIRFAKEENIPILPFLMEEVPEALYSLPENFEDAQYLSPFSKDATALQYSEKLNKRLDAVFTDSSTLWRVRAAFDSYIFLSYRKADRAYANELMRLLHTHPDCWDVAVWYDEFLVPGESFRRNIDRAMEESKFVTLLVTPTLLKRHENGEPNFVMREEYPAAQRLGKSVFPVEMQATDPDLLAKEFPGIPDRADPADREVFFAALSHALTGVRDPENDSDPEHKYLIGMAYLYGIDMETDRERGIALIREAAEAGDSEAMAALYHIYENGVGVHYDYREALVWIKRLYALAEDELGENDPQTLDILYELACTYCETGDHTTALPLLEKNLSLCEKVFGKKHLETVRVLIALGATYFRTDEVQKSIAVLEKARRMCRRIPDFPHHAYASLLGNLASVYQMTGNFKKSFALQEEAYALSRKYSGDESPDTLTELMNIANAYQLQGDAKKALALFRAAHGSFEKVLGADDPQTLACALGMATSQNALGNYEEGRRIADETYGMAYDALGARHPDTLTLASVLAQSLQNLGHFQKALELTREVYPRCRKVFGDKNSTTLLVLMVMTGVQCATGECTETTYENAELAYTLSREMFGAESPYALGSLNVYATATRAMKRYEQAGELFREAYALCRRQLGERHAATLNNLLGYANVLVDMGKYKRGAELQEVAYNLYCREFGEKHPNALVILNNLATTYAQCDEREKAIELLQKCYLLYCKTMGAEHPNAICIQSNLAEMYDRMGERQRAYELLREAFFTACTSDARTAEKVLATVDGFCADFKDSGDIFLYLRYAGKAGANEQKKAAQIEASLRAQLHVWTHLKQDINVQYALVKRIFYIHALLHGCESKEAHDEAVKLMRYFKKEAAERIFDGLAQRVALLAEEGELDGAEYLQGLLFSFNCSVYGSGAEESALALKGLADIRISAKKHREALANLELVQLRYTALFGAEDARTEEVGQCIAALKALLSET